MSIRANVERLQREGAELLSAINGTLELLHRTDPSRSFISRQHNIDISLIKTGYSYYDSVEFIELTNGKLSIRLGNIKVLVTVNVNPVKDNFAVTTYRYALDLRDLTLTKEVLIPIKEVEIIYQRNNMTLAGVKISYTDVLIAEYLDGLIKFYGELPY